MKGIKTHKRPKIPQRYAKLKAYKQLPKQSIKPNHKHKVLTKTILTIIITMSSMEIYKSKLITKIYNNNKSKVYNILTRLNDIIIMIIKLNKYIII